MHSKYTRRLIGIAAALFAAAAAPGQDYELDWFSIDGGGEMFGAGGNLAVGSTVGQPDANAGVLSGGAFEVIGGFWAIRAGLLGDLNCDGAINAFDIDPFVLALTSAPDFDAYYAAYPDCDPLLADINGDGEVNGFDIDAFVDLLTGG